MSEAPLISSRALMAAALSHVDPADEAKLAEFEQAVQRSREEMPQLVEGADE